MFNQSMPQTEHCANQTRHTVQNYMWLHTQWNNFITQKQNWMIKFTIQI